MALGSRARRDRGMISTVITAGETTAMEPSSVVDAARGRREQKTRRRHRRRLASAPPPPDGVGVACRVRTGSVNSQSNRHMCRPRVPSRRRRASRPPRRRGARTRRARRRAPSKHSSPTRATPTGCATARRARVVCVREAPGRYFPYVTFPGTRDRQARVLCEASVGLSRSVRRRPALTFHMPSLSRDARLSGALCARGVARGRRDTTAATTQRTAHEQKVVSCIHQNGLR